jgi:hypothetical protein
VGKAQADEESRLKVGRATVSRYLFRETEVRHI